MKEKSLSNAAKPGIFVDIDALFDTRLAVLDDLDPLLAAYVLENGYFNREEDSFKYCDFEMFQKLYKARDNDILAKSVITNVKNIIVDFVKDCERALKGKVTPNVYINVYPYKIKSSVCGDILKPLYKMTGGRANIHLVNMSEKELTVDVCRDNLSYVIKYDFMPWLLSLGEQKDIITKPLNEVTLIAPRLYQSGKPHENHEALSRNEIPPFRCTEIFFAPYITLELLVPELFSASLNPLFIEDYLKEIDLFQQQEKQ